MSDDKKRSRRVALKVLGASAVGAAMGLAGRGARAEPEPQVHSDSPWFRRFFQTHYRRMTPDEVAATIARLEKRYSKRYGRDVQIDNTPAAENTLYGFALNLDKCKGYRDCVDACVKENNQTRDPEMQYIRVLQIERGSLGLADADHHYDPPEVPEAGKVYLPVQCFQCDNPPCVKACPVDATWTERDGVVVVDYERCIGCRYCATACPYWARHFNWQEPEIPAKELNTNMHYLSNRPRKAGVIEKCTYCLQRTRKGNQPACQEACPTGARVFGNLLDPHSDIRYVLENKTVFRLKEELGTEPKFWYYTE